MKAVDSQRAQEARRATLVGLGLALATLAVYLQVRDFGFINYDDLSMLVENPVVADGLTLRNILWAFSTSWFEYWHPLTWLSHMLDYELFGARPGWHHLVSVGLHVANTILLFAVLRRMTGALWRSAIVAALFALHPTHVESVAWLAERKDVLSGLFFMLTLWAYARYAECRRKNAEYRMSPASSLQSPVSSLQSPAFYLLSLLLFACGLMSKPMVVTLPFVLLLLDYWPLRRLQLATHHAPSSLLRLVLEKLPFFALTAASCAITYSWAVTTGNTAAAINEPWGLRLANAPVSYVRYIGKTIWPADLTVLYPMPDSWAWWQVGGAVLVLALISWAVLARARSSPYGLVGWLIFLGMLFPSIRLLQSAHQSIADRYTYLPSIGLFLLLVWGVAELGARWRWRRDALGAAAVVILAALLVSAQAQTRYWRDSEALFRHALEVTRDNWLAHNNLAGALSKKGRVDEAIAQYHEVLRLKPDDAETHKNLGGAFAMKGQLDQAIAQYHEAIRLKPDDAEAHTNLGSALAMKGRIDDALAQYQEAIRLKPDHAIAHLNLGNVFKQLGRVEESIRAYQAGLKLKPEAADAQCNLATLLLRQGRIEEAIPHFQLALNANPSDVVAHNNLGMAFLRQGRASEAIAQFQQALRIRPDYAEARNNLNAALAAKANPPQPPASSTDP
ncbi:MAG TPA: tetratricopeptide repeat protein [Verrucomicrobiota bacterium]|nr:tetratricopeptide repeat protein [Verrucomicrobiota bacterium]